MMIAYYFFLGMAGGILIYEWIVTWKKLRDFKKRLKK
jgi:hypothetical protein